MPRRGPLAAALLLLGALAARASSVQAHEIGVSRGDYRADGARVHAEVFFARRELLTALPALDDRGSLRDLASTDARAALAEWLRDGLLIATADGACALARTSGAPSEGDGVALLADFECPKPVDAFSVRLASFADLSLGHRHLLTMATQAGERVRAVLYETEPALALPAAAARAPTPGGGVVTGMFRLGVAHILGGYDHLLFLLAVVLVGGSWRAILGVVTAFTLAHTLTLTLAVVQTWTPPPSLIEPAIALSIVYVGIENCVAQDLRRRWRLTFLFGLVHGFGFAAALREAALAAGELPIALGAFNLGVEAGQLAVLAVVLPFVTLLARRPWFLGGGLQAASLAISGAGLWWFLERV